MNILIILGHPRRDCYCAALADAYAAGAAKVPAVNMRRLHLGALRFDPHVRVDSPENQPLEPDLQAARADLHWADHLVFVYPNWWGTMPALLKGFFDRVLMPGDSFQFYGPGALEWDGLLRGKSAQLITTMDTPPLAYRWVFGAPGKRGVKDATLGFCGIKTVRSFIRGPLRTSSEQQRQRWLRQVEALGAGLEHGVRSPLGRRLFAVKRWLAALRLQFYPMTWAAYTIGALAGAAAGLDWVIYVLGYLFLFTLEAATVFSNEYIDFSTDASNLNFGPFTGGSRTLVDGLVSFREMRWGMTVALTASLLFLLMAWLAASAGAALILWSLLALILTLGYTARPFRFCYRGLGEIDVAFTHSLLVLMLGYLGQGGALFAAEPWLLSAPLALAIVPAILLAGIPDRHADAAVGKYTIAVVFGVRATLLLAAAMIVASAALATGYAVSDTLAGVYSGIMLPVIIHGALCLWLLRRAARRHAQGHAQRWRIDATLFVTLSYMLWFVGVPFYWLL